MSRLVAFALTWVVIVASFGRAAQAEIDADKVRKAIDQGVDYLLRQQGADGTWTEYNGYPTGVTSLCTLALLTAGVPASDPHIQKVLTLLRKTKLPMTYSLSLQTMVLCAAEPKKDQLLIRSNVRWLEEQQLRSDDKKGAWGYGGNHGTGDNSNTQFAILALHEAERAGVPVSEQTWRLALNYWQRTQNLDGSWGYMPGLSGTGSMTCAGIAAMVVAGEKLNPGDAEYDDSHVRCCGVQETNATLERALAWLGRHFSVHVNPGADRGNQTYLLYYLYGIERAGRLTNQRFIGQHDWYREGADMLVDAQDELGGGQWKGTGHAEDNPHIATALALLYLSKGRRPILISKLKHAPIDDWNHHRTDLGNLTAYVEQRWKRDLTWQIIDVAHASPDDLLQSPVLFLSGRLPPEFSDRQVQNLREYVDRGGFLFAEACCGGQEFDRGFRKLMQRMFPEPEHELRLLPPEHPVWTAEERVEAKYLRPLWGVDIGCRTSVVYCPDDLGCYWEIARMGRDDKLPPAIREQVEAARSIGINVLAYATNRELKFKLEGIEPPLTAEDRDPVERGRIWIAKLRHSGGWNVAPQALPNLMRTVARNTSLRVNVESRELSLLDPQIFEHHMLFMHGRNSFQFSPAERKQLRKFVELGGMLFADAICGSAAFADAFRLEMATVFKEHPLTRIPADHPIFSTTYGGFDLKRVTLRELEPHADGGQLKTVSHQVEPDLEGVKIGDQYGVIFSPHDLSCALERHETLECPGYSRDDAARIGLNVILYSLAE
ncbi:MAG TPA: DUF4159 domain-containing protein [Pirellulales bacterium]|nr:DUF4159 domain-containing protein [Pirellulales bacterium]